ncbi:histidine kinase [Pseudoflavitalea sp. X16]|uniref:sensor histidine kinase n=1 Tax=Paraflavitalea devenefica TaxID=2716334 RepID=UPI00141FB6EB|nr:histidine kinase [Paraflavitalea devenefica]NII25624.1 histidine kinase [Paraflavitalea devenefica]
MSTELTIESSKRWKRILLHTIVWLMVFSLPYLLRLYDNRLRENPDAIQFFYLGNLTSICWVITFYLNAYVFIPKFLYPKKYSILVVLLLVTYSVAIALHSLFYELIITNRPYRLMNAISFNLPPFLMCVTASIAYRLIADKAKNDQLLQARQQETMQSELSFLRSQISPHFMFNVLNNMLAMARAKSDQLEPTILKLSSLMRYILYESDGEKVLIKKETEYLESYIDLQRQRLSSKVVLKVSIHAPEGNQEIAPMLLIPFIENAFKHGTGYMEKPEIHIDLYVKEESLHFTVSNKFNPATTEIKDKTSGIGLANVKRRLNLLYPERHNLLITDNDNWFTVSLQINLADHVKVHSSR